MASIKITRQAVERLPKAPGPGPAYYFDEVLKGFAVRVSPQGVKAFVVQGRAGGKLHRRSLGRWPTVSPEDARKRARAVLDVMAGGDAPVNRRELVTVGAALDEWLSVHAAHKLKPRTARDYQEIVEKVLKPELGHRAVAEIERADIAKLHHDRHRTPRRANYVLAIAKTFFNYCERAGYRPEHTNPANRIEQFPQRSRERFLSDEEIGRAAAAITECEQTGILSLHAAAALRLCILTGARQGEIKGLRWREVDIPRRLLLLEDSKTGRKPIYLSEPAIEVLKSLPRVEDNPYVIVGDRPGEPYQNLTRAWIKVRKRAGLDDVRLHDLRHTFASVGAAESLSLPMIGRLLGHRVPATTARYAHLASDPVTEANERVGARLARVMRGVPADPAEGEDTGE